MSVLSLFQRNGKLKFIEGVGLPVDPVKHGGVKANTDGAIYATLANPIDFHSQGLPFDIAGRLSIAVGEAVHHYSQGVPYTAEGRVLTDEGTVVYFDQASGFTAAGEVANDTTTVLGSASLPENAP